MHIAGLAHETCGHPSDHVNRRSDCLACSMHHMTPGAITLLCLEHISSCCVAELIECATLVVSDSKLRKSMLWLMPIKPGR